MRLTLLFCLIVLVATADAAPLCAELFRDASTIVKSRSKAHVENRALAIQLLRIRRRGILLTKDQITKNIEDVRGILGLPQLKASDLIKTVSSAFNWRTIHEELASHERSDTYLTWDRLHQIFSELTKRGIPRNTATLRFDPTGDIQRVLSDLNLESNPRAILTTAMARFGGLDQLLFALKTEGDRLRYDKPADKDDIFDTFELLEANRIELVAATVRNESHDVLADLGTRIRSIPILNNNIHRLFGDWSTAVSEYKMAREHSRDKAQEKVLKETQFEHASLSVLLQILRLQSISIPNRLNAAQRSELSDAFRKGLSRILKTDREIILKMIEYYEIAPAMNISSAQFRNFYFEETGFELTNGMIDAAAKRLANNQTIRNQIEQIRSQTQ